MRTRILISCFLILFYACNNTERKAESGERGDAGQDSLEQEVTHAVAEAKGIVGIAMQVIETGDSFYYNADKNLPMQSTYKFPLAMYALHLADSGKLSLNKTIHISAKELDQDTWSPMADSFKNGVTLSVRDIMRYMVSESDNIACDIIFRETGGPAKANEYIHSLGVDSISIKATEAAMHQDWETQYTNWCEARAMLRLLEIFYKKQALSDSSNALLWKFMVESTNSPKRIMGLLPVNTVVAHKTGTGGSQNNIASATNDIGIVTLPNGKHLAIVVFVSNSRNTSIDAREHVIARIAKAGYDYFTRESL